MRDGGHGNPILLRSPPPRHFRCNPGRNRAHPSGAPGFPGRHRQGQQAVRQCRFPGFGTGARWRDLPPECGGWSTPTGVSSAGGTARVRERLLETCIDEPDADEGMERRCDAVRETVVAVSGHRPNPVRLHVAQGNFVTIRTTSLLSPPSLHRGASSLLPFSPGGSGTTSLGNAGNPLQSFRSVAGPAGTDVPK